MLLRSLDTLGEVVGPHTRLILRTDAAPFNVLVQGPPRADPKTAPGRGAAGARHPASPPLVGFLGRRAAPGRSDERPGPARPDPASMGSAGHGPEARRSGDARPAGILGAARLS